jgi:ribosomal-protein-alanine N-acetyltransferase
MSSLAASGFVQPPLPCGWASTDSSEHAFHRYLRRSRSPTAVCRLIWRRVDDVLLGAIHLTGIVRGIFQSAYLGYYLGKRFAGRPIYRRLCSSCCTCRSRGWACTG